MNKVVCENIDHPRVIIHFDIDCFYAQVEMVRNPSLKEKPLGIQQKNLMVTCNYVARSMGVKKSMWIEEAKKILPDIILINGSDLTHYRQFSAEIFSILQSYTNMVEKLGMDENFIDVTDILDDFDYSEDVIGHIFSISEEENKNNSDSCLCGCHERLIKGTHIAKRIREHIYESTGLTTCGGIAYNKTLSKLISGYHKPNDQTIIFPCQVESLMKSLNSARDIPGIGHVTFKSLESLGIKTVEDLQLCPIGLLYTIFEEDFSHRLKNISFGVDDNPVKSSGLPQTLSLEDAFKKVSSLEEVRAKLEILCERLLKLLIDDGRFPSSLRVTIRKYKKDRKFGQRESKHVPIPSSLFGSSTTLTINQTTIDKLLDISLQTVKKMINISQSFHLTLIGIGFTKFYERAQNLNSISHFLTKRDAGSPNTNKKLKLSEGLLHKSSRNEDEQAQGNDNNTLVKEGSRVQDNSQENQSNVQMSNCRGTGENSSNHIFPSIFGVSICNSPKEEGNTQLPENNEMKPSTHKDSNPCSSKLGFDKSKSKMKQTKLDTFLINSDSEVKSFKLSETVSENPSCSSRIKRNFSPGCDIKEKLINKGFDMEVFDQLPIELKEEIISQL